MNQIELFPTPTTLPEGFLYRPELISVVEEQALAAAIEELAFAEIKMHGVVAKRRAVHFGRDYEYQTAKLGPAPPIPEFLLPLRERVADLAQRASQEFAEVLVTDYPAGAGIGWHRDAPAFDIVVGVSLLSACTMQFRGWPVEQGRSKRSQPLAQVLDPRSVYILRGPSRTQWQHHIPAITTRRFSITFRTLRSSS